MFSSLVNIPHEPNSPTIAVAWYDVSMEETVHVAALEPEQQLALRFTLGNYMKLQIKSLITSASSVTNPASIDARWQKARGILNYYENMVELFPTIKTFDRAQTQVVYFNTQSLDVMIKSLEMFDARNNAGMEQEEIEIVEHEFDALKSLLTNSRKFLYTKAEIERARKRG